MDFGIPEDRVLGFKNPVVFVGEIDEATGDALTLERGVKLKALRDGDAVVEFAVDHERWRLEVRSVGHGVLRVVGRSFFPWRAAGGLVEPVNGRVGGVLGIKVGDPGVADDSLEAVGVAGDPRGKVAAVTGAECSGARGVEEGVFLEEVIRGEHHIGEGFVAPRSVDGADKFFAVTGRAVTVDPRGYVAGGGEDVGVPAGGPRVANHRVGAAVHELEQRIFFLGVEGWRIDEPTGYRVAAGAGERVGLDATEFEPGKEGGVEVGALGGSTVGKVDGEDFVGAGEGLIEKVQRFFTDGEGATRAEAKNFDGLGGDALAGKAEGAREATVFSEEENGFSVGGKFPVLGREIGAPEGEGFCAGGGEVVARQAGKDRERILAGATTEEDGLAVGGEDGLVSGPSGLSAVRFSHGAVGSSTLRR